jgi:hypothetical protein
MQFCHAMAKPPSTKTLETVETMLVTAALETHGFAETFPETMDTDVDTSA